MRRRFLGYLFLAILATGCGLALGLGDFEDAPGSAGAAASASATTSSSAGGTSSISSGGGGQATASGGASTASGAGGAATSSTGTVSSASAGGGGSGGSIASGGSGGGATRTVQGTETITYLSPTPKALPADLATMATITVLGGTALTPINGMGFVTGAFSVPGVPQGRYELALTEPNTQNGNLPTYYVTNTDKPDMSRFVAGRSDVVPITSPTPLSFFLSNLDPWVPMDVAQNYAKLAAVSLGAGISVPHLATAAGATPVTTGTDVTFTGTIDASAAFSPPNLVSAGKGDTLYVFQHTKFTTTSGLVASHLSKYAAVNTLTQTNGSAGAIGAATAPVAMTALAQGRTAMLDWDLPSFEQQVNLVNANAVVQSDTFDTYAYAGLTGTPRIAFTTLLEFSPATGGQRLTTTLPFGSPYASGFYIAECVDTAFGVPLTFPGTQPDGGALAPANLVADSTYCADQFTFESQSPVVPIISPPQNVTVGGVDGAAGGSLSSLTPGVSFDAPVTGTATRYSVQIWGVTKTNSNTVLNKLGEIFSKSTTPRIPPGLLHAGGYYAFIITAWSFPPTTADTTLIDAETTPRKQRLPSALASNITEVFAAP